MKQVLSKIQDGSFANEWIKENQTGLHNFHKYRQEIIEHPIEKIWEELRETMKIKDRQRWWWSKEFLAEEQKKQDYN